MSETGEATGGSHAGILVIDECRDDPQLQDGSRLGVEERRRRILDLLEARGRVTVEGLAREFTVSAVTARTDLDALARIGALHRSHGGAVRAIDPGHDYPLRLKTILHHEQKAAIARAAVQLVRPHQTLMLDSGTTTGEIARRLREAPVAGIAVVTNSLGIAAELSQVRDCRVVLVGGLVREVSQSCVGPEAERMMRGLRADHLFLAADGIDPTSGPCTPDALEARLNGL
ncbi:MAG TPA: DeoR/GlpR family DNA-binding transcription regulator, partial [Bryobacteraceae bacterium]|nr:DeoR/GlpR family DNA-binding transcription regulator [Bryobacteraceae bacterium]